MPKFKIEMELTSINERLLLTDFDSSENLTGGITFNENLTEEENDIYNLTFSVTEKINGISIENLIAVGRPLWIHTYSPNRSIRMVISSFRVIVAPENNVYEIEARDYASYAFARNNAGLTLDTIEDEDFIDWMKQRGIPFPPKIKNIADHILQRGWLQRPNGQGWTVEVDSSSSGGLRSKSDITLNFFVSESNTYNALVELANLSNTFLVFDYVNEKVTFLDKESSNRDKNYTLQRNFNVQDLGISYSAEELYSIFYVQGGENEFGFATILSDATAYRDNFLFNFNYFRDRNLLTEQQKNAIESQINTTLANINNALIRTIREKFTVLGQISEYETQLNLLGDSIMLTEDGKDYMSTFQELTQVFFRKETDLDESVEKVFSLPTFFGTWATLPPLNFVFSFPAIINYDGNSIEVFDQEQVITVDGAVFKISFVELPGSEATTTNNFVFYYNTIAGAVRPERLGIVSSLVDYTETVQWDVLKPIFPYLALLDSLDGNAAISEARGRWSQRVNQIKQLWTESAQIIASSSNSGEIEANEKLINEVYRIGIGEYDPLTNTLDPKKPGKFTIILSLFDQYNAIYPRISAPRILQRYRDLTAQKQNFWYDLKKNRQHVFVEGYYDNDVEITAQDLKEQAEAIYLDFQRPLEDFSITYIDLSDIIGINITDIRPGDFVKLKEDKLQIQQIEESKLRVASISRTLRDKGNISLTIYRHNMINTVLEKIMARSQ